MGESNTAVTQRRKSRTPVKIIANDLKKKKKWSEEDENVEKVTLKRGFSANDSNISPIKNEEAE